jgi:hypothetical protein
MDKSVEGITDKDITNKLDEESILDEMITENKNKKNCDVDYINNRYNLNLGSFYDLELYQRILARTETENAIISTTKKILYPLEVLFR